MSNVSNTHDVIAYVSGTTKALSGQRLAKVTYKKDKETGIKKESRAVSIPAIATNDIQENLAVLLPAIRSFLESQQDAIVRKLVDSGASVVQDSDISMAAIASFAEEENTGARLTKESIGAWFDTGIADTLRVAFADRLGLSNTPTADEMFRVETAVATYKDKFAAMAGGKTSYIPEVAEKLAKALEFAADDDEIAVKFRTRLEKMKTVAAVDMLGL